MERLSDSKIEKSTGMIIKNLAMEAEVKEVITYIPIRGASQVKNYRAPNSYVFLLFEQCSGIHTVDFKDYIQRPLQLHISFPAQIHSWDTGADAIGHKLIINREFIEEFQFSSHFSTMKSNNFPVIDIDQQTFNKLVTEFIAIEEELSIQKASLKWQLAKLRLHLILVLINNLIENNNNTGVIDPKISQVLLRFSELVDENFKTSKSVTQYAESLYVTPNYLNILCNKHLGMTAKEFIRHRLLLEAKRLLKGSNIRIKELAFYLGFSEPSNFTNFLKKYSNSTPSQIRSENSP